MADEKQVGDIKEDWSLIVEPKEPHKSLILYKGQPVQNVTSAGVTLEPVIVGEGKSAVLPVLTIKIATSSLVLGTYTAPKEPVQQELPLETKP